MKKIRAIKYISILLFIIYISIILVAYLTDYISANATVWFSIVLAVVSINCCFKGAVLKSYSTLWFAVSLVLYALLIIVFEVNRISYGEFNYYFAVLPVVTSLIFICFGKLNYIYAIIINLSVAIPIFIINLFSLNIWLKIAVFTVFVLVGLLLSRAVYIKREKF